MRKGGTFQFVGSQSHNVTDSQSPYRHLFPFIFPTAICFRSSSHMHNMDKLTQQTYNKRVLCLSTLFMPLLWDRSPRPRRLLPCRPQ
jgi:hypothetical protein